MPRIRFPSRLLVPLVQAVLCLSCVRSLSSTLFARSADQKWVRVSSAHFSVLTDAGEKKGRETVSRLEQMRDIFAQLFRKTKLRMSEPLDVIALRSDEEYIRVAPLRQGRAISAPGFFLDGADRNYIVLDLAAEDSWRAVSRELALVLLRFNYPATQDWFDEGFAQYFSSLKLADSQAQVGDDPTGNRPWESVVPGQSAPDAKPRQSFVKLLDGQWLPMPDLLRLRPGANGYPARFYAQSWMLMHYLLNRDKLSETGTYFGLLQIQKLPVEQAFQQAFALTPAQFEQIVKEYFHSRTWNQTAASLDATKAARSGSPVYQFPSMLEAGQVGASVVEVTDPQARALVAEMSLRLPEHRGQAEKDLQNLIDDPKTDNAVAHRGVAWVHLTKQEFDPANDELARAVGLDARDPWPRYYQALVKFRLAQSQKNPIRGVSNMIQDLVAVVDWNSDFAEAHNMLAMARLEGGGVHAATDSIRVAIQLSPRNQQYILNLAQIHLAEKKWDDAKTLLEQLQSSMNPQIAAAAGKSLKDLPTLKKYGVLPQEGGSSRPEASDNPQVPAQSPPGEDDSGVEEKDNSGPTETKTVLDKRKILFLRGKLLRVDCSGPAAILTVKSADRNIKLRTDNYKLLPLIGADEFSCEWTNLAVTVNYKAGGQTGGDLVSVEVQQGYSK